MRTSAIVMTLALVGNSMVCAQTDARQKKSQGPAHKGASSPQARHKAPSVTRPPAARPVVESPMGQEELAIAGQVYQGHLPCELGVTVRIEPDQARPGYFNVLGNNFRYRMHPVTSTSGAIRLEDRQAGAVWLQLANKSMLMDQKQGRRLADDCAHPDQLAVAQDMKNNPPPPLIEVNTGR